MSTSRPSLVVLLNLIDNLDTLETSFLGLFDEFWLAVLVGLELKQIETHILLFCVGPGCFASSHSLKRLYKAGGSPSGGGYTVSSGILRARAYVV
jgi:hypothetical protein